MTDYRYLIATGSNRRHHRFGSPHAILKAVPELLESAGLRVIAAAPVIDSAPIGPSARRYANSALMIATALEPDALLARLKRLERGLGRRRGQRWSARWLDLDIILWSGGSYAARRLIIPHPRFRERPFVLAPAARLAPRWRDPVTGLSLAQLLWRANRQSPTPSC